MTSDDYKATQYKWLAEFFAEAVRTGREMQQCSRDGVWRSRVDGPGLYSNKVEWRLKPEPQKAWVVWYDSEDGVIAAASTNKQRSERFAKDTNGTIQEITRPEPK